MTDNVKLIFLPIPGASEYGNLNLYRKATYILAQMFNHAHPEYSVNELCEKGWNYLISTHSILSKTISWFHRFFFGWNDAVELVFGVRDSNVHGRVWFCMPTYGHIKNGMFVSATSSYKIKLNGVEEYIKTADNFVTSLWRLKKNKEETE